MYRHRLGDSLQAQPWAAFAAKLESLSWRKPNLAAHGRPIGPERPVGAVQIEKEDPVTADLDASVVPADDPIPLWIEAHVAHPLASEQKRASYRW